MVTIEQAMSATRFKRVVGKPIQVRRTGKTQRWKTRPNEFKIPVKYGLYESGYITDQNAADWEVVS